MVSAGAVSVDNKRCTNDYYRSMGYDDDDRANAYERAVNNHDNGTDDNDSVDRATFIEFANIVQHYDDTARPPHDDIDFEPADYDGSEYDFGGEPVTLYGLIVINLGPAFGDVFDDYVDDPFDYLYDKLRGLRKPRRDDIDDDPYLDHPLFGDDESEW